MAACHIVSHVTVLYNGKGLALVQNSGYRPAVATWLPPEETGAAVTQG